MTAPQPWPTTHLCPATSNLPTRMLASTWQALCAAMQRRESVGASRGKGGMAPEDFKAISAARFPCATCQGRTMPPGLELITQEEAEQMARTTKRGICELCGANSNVGTNHGSKVCTNCTHIQSALSKRPQSVANAIRAMGKTEEMLSHLIPAGGLAVKVTADLLQEISGIVGYDGEDPAELVAAVRAATALGAHQLTSEAEAGALRTIAGIVGYEGTNGEQLVEAVRKRVLTCASCDAAEALLEIAELVGKRGASSGLVVEAVRMAVIGDPINHCADCTALRGDLLRACGLEMDDTEDGEGWDVAAAAAIQTIARTEYRRDFWASKATLFKIEAGDLRSELLVKRGEIDELRNEIARLNGQTHSESEQVTALRDDLSRSSGVIEQLRAELTLLEQAHDEWEQRAVHAEQNVETLEAEVQERDRDDDRSFNRLGLLDIAIAALRGDAVPSDQIAGLLAIARKVAA